MPFQVLNPMEAMQVGADRARANRLADIQEADIVRAQREREMLNQLYRQSYNPQTGGVDFNRLYGGLAGQNMGAAISGIQKSQADIAKTQADALKAAADVDKIKGETIDSRTNYWRSLIPTDPSMAPAWVESVYKDPLVGPILSQIGSKDQVIATIPKDPKEYPQWARQWAMGAKDFAKEMMKYTTPESPEVFAQTLGKAAAGKTSVNIPISTGKKFGETIAEQAGTELGNMQKQAQAGLDVQESIRRLQPLLNSKDFISGTLGDVRLAVAKALGLPGAAETQAYFAGIGDQVASRVKAFGSGSAISNADREFAEKMAGGNIELTPDAIKRIVRLNDESAALAVKGYNKRRKFLMKANPEIANYFEEITPKPTQPSGRDVVRTGTLNGRKVVQYSDGTLEYAD